MPESKIKIIYKNTLFIKIYVTHILYTVFIKKFTFVDVIYEKKKKFPALRRFLNLVIISNIFEARNFELDIDDLDSSGQLT